MKWHLHISAFKAADCYLRFELYMFVFRLALVSCLWNGCALESIVDQCRWETLADCGGSFFESLNVSVLCYTPANVQWFLQFGASMYYKVSHFMKYMHLGFSSLVNQHVWKTADFGSSFTESWLFLFTFRLITLGDHYKHVKWHLQNFAFYLDDYYNYVKYYKLYMLSWNFPAVGLVFIPWFLSLDNISLIYVVTLNLECLCFVLCS